MLCSAPCICRWREAERMRGAKKPVEMYLLAGGVGFVFGALVSFANAQITRHSVRKNSVNAIMAASILRMLVNIAALAVVYFTRNLLPLPFYGTIVGTAAGLSLVGILLNLKLSKEQLKDPQNNPESTDGRN